MRLKFYSLLLIITLTGFLFASDISMAYSSNVQDQVNLVFNVLTGKSCDNLYDVANAIYRNQANKYNTDITLFTSYNKVKHICQENRFVCSEDYDKLLFKIRHIENIRKHYKVATVDFYTKNDKRLITKCFFTIKTKDKNREYSISLPYISTNLKQCLETIENKPCVVKALNNIYTTLETLP